jgi:hypothetical protein
MLQHPRTTLLAAFLVLLGASPSRAADRPRVETKRPVEADAATSQARRATWIPTVPAPGGGIFVPRELASLALLPGAHRPRARHPRTGIFDRAAGAIGANVRINDPSEDPPRTCNAETHMAASGDYLVAGFNDGAVFPESPGASGYAYSIDGGDTWTDGGILPTTAPAVYNGDPVIATDGAGNFYYASLYSSDGNNSTISVNRGRFEDDRLVWSDPVTTFLPTGDLLDKEWLACDPDSGIVYVTCTRFVAGGGSQIEFTRSTDFGATWSPRRLLTSFIAQGSHGSRVVVGPGGEVIVLYYAYHYGSRLSSMRMRRSLDHGATWQPEQVLPCGPSGVLVNYGAGPPGFNRSRGIGLPSLAVDRSTGPHRGRLYATWEETVDYLGDPVGTLDEILEREPNGSADTAIALTIGQRISGTVEAPRDEDWFRFSGEAGRTVIVYLSPGTANPGAADIRVFCEGGGPENRAMWSDLGLGYGLIVYTLPRSGDYFLSVRVSNFLGTYQVNTGWHTPAATDLARDTRDVILQTSADQITWDPPRVVDRGAPGADESFPEVAVDGSGALWIDWYGHRLDSCAIASDVFFTRSTDGGATWAPAGQVNDGPSINWNLTASNLAPNMGDYMALVADGCRVYANFTDARDGTPDAWIALLDECPTPIGLAWRGFRLTGSGVRLAWQALDGRPLVAVVERTAADGAWIVVGSVTADAAGNLEFLDSSAVRGRRYGYRLRVQDAGDPVAGSEAWIEIPARARLTLATEPVSTGGTLALTVTVPESGAARLEIFDVSGRRVRALDRELEAGRHRLTLDGFEAGLYWLMLVQGSDAARARSVVLR